jgi:hypothetical protein
MMNRRSFGRRESPRFARARAEAVVQDANAPIGVAAAEPPVLPAARLDSPSLDQELQDWKRSRKQGFEFPWRQLCLMASLCFGVASFVLPASVNDNVQWLLYALTAASLYAGFSRRLRKAKAT